MATDVHLDRVDRPEPHETAPEASGEVGRREPAGHVPVSGRSVARGVMWAASGRVVAQLLQFGSGIIVARVLAPADLGLLAIVYLITGLAVLFFDLGVPGALIQQRHLTREDLNTGFWLNALGGVFFVACLAAAGPFVAMFFHDARLVWLTPLGGLSFLVGIGVVQFALLSRGMKMRHLVAAEVVGALVSNIGTVIAVLAHPAPVALVIGPPIGVATVTAILWAMVPWRPTGFITKASLKKLWSFSSGAFASNLAWYVSANLDTLAIGKFVGKGQLGYYNRAYNLMDTPLQQVGGAIGRVLFPALASFGDDVARVRAAYRRAVRLICAFATPMLVGLAVTAPGVTVMLWGARWNPAVPIIQALCLAGVPMAMATSTAWLYESQGRTRTMAVMSLAGIGLKLPAVAIGVHWGALGVAVGFAITALVSWPLSAHVAGRAIGAGAGRLMRDNLPTVAIALVMGAVTWWLPEALGLSRHSPVTVLVQALVGVSTYLGALIVLQRALLTDIITLVRSRR